MPRTTRLLAALTALPLAAGALAALPAPAHAQTWTPIASTTTEDITAVEYQSPTRFWFTTSNGAIYRRVGASFTLAHAPHGLPLYDIEFHDPGGFGVAVGAGGVVLRSSDHGATWSRVILPTGGTTGPTPTCDVPGSPVGDLDTVHFTSPNEVWVVGSGTQLFRSLRAGEVGSWSYANRTPAGSCIVPADVDDMWSHPARPDLMYFAGKSFGTVYLTTDGLRSPATARPADAGNGFTGTRRLTGDPDHPNRQWAVSPGGSGNSYLRRTTDAWSTSAPFNVRTTAQGVMYDVAARGGTVITVGTGGIILASRDGATFTLHRAPGALASHDWRTVSLASGSAAAIGGADGRLVVTSDAHVVTTPPTAVRTTPPSRVRSLRVKGTRSAKARKVVWRAPASNGRARITGYRIVVKKGKKTILRTRVGGAKRSYVLKRGRLRAGKLRVYVSARNARGYGPSAAKTFRVRKP